MFLGDAARIPLKDQSVDLVFGSPPYLDARTYGIGADRKLDEWIDWMLKVSMEAMRVCRGPVLWVVAGCTRGRNYQPGPEGLLYRWNQLGMESYRPVCWHRQGIPGSGGNDWLRSDWEYVLCLKRSGALSWSENTACGKPPVEDWMRKTPRIVRLANGKKVREKTTSSIPDHGKANPGNVIKTLSGGGNLGDSIAHESEAPFPEKLAEFFIRSFCPPSGSVFDPFSGSFTTVKVARECGRVGIGSDIRPSQIELGKRRLSSIQRQLF